MSLDLVVHGGGGVLGYCCSGKVPWLLVKPDSSEVGGTGGRRERGGGGVGTRNPNPKFKI